MHRHLLLSVAAGALVAPAPLWAQTDSSPAPPATVAEADGIPDVLVTARRRLEEAQQVPASFSVVSGELLDRSYTVNAQALTTLVPSLNYSSANPRNRRRYRRLPWA